MQIPNLLDLLRRYKYVWLTGSLLLLAATFLFGTYPGGQGPAPVAWLLRRLSAAFRAAEAAADRLPGRLPGRPAAHQLQPALPADPYLDHGRHHPGAADQPARPGYSFAVYSDLHRHCLPGFG
jgi:hypothetical protein